MTKRRAPKHLRARGKRIWNDLCEAMSDEAQVAALEEVCRMADRLDRLDEEVRGVPELVKSRRDTQKMESAETGELYVYVETGKALSEVRQQQATFKALLREVRDYAAAAEARAGSAEAATPDTSKMSPLERVMAEGRATKAG